MGGRLKLSCTDEMPLDDRKFKKLVRKVLHPAMHGIAEIFRETRCGWATRASNSSFQQA